MNTIIRVHGNRGVRSCLPLQLFETRPFLSKQKLFRDRRQQLLGVFARKAKGYVRIIMDNHGLDGRPRAKNIFQRHWQYIFCVVLFIVLSYVKL